MQHVSELLGTQLEKLAGVCKAANVACTMRVSESALAITFKRGEKRGDTFTLAAVINEQTGDSFVAGIKAHGEDEKPSFLYNGDIATHVSAESLQLRLGTLGDLLKTENKVGIDSTAIVSRIMTALKQNCSLGSPKKPCQQGILNEAVASLIA